MRAVNRSSSDQARQGCWASFPALEGAEESGELLGPLRHRLPLASGTGCWEGNLIIGRRGKSQIATLAERVTRFTKLVRVPYDHTADRVAARLSAEVEHLSEDLRRSLAHPHAPWQRGSNENTNGLLRQYFPKGTDLSSYTQAELDTVTDKLNTRPRRVLGWNAGREAQRAATEWLKAVW